MVRSTTAAAAAVVLVALAACQATEDGPWFKGDLAAARAAAAERDTLIMLEFATDWCSWCRRLENDTFSRPEVRELLASLVAVRLDAEQDGRELARRYGIDSYPTIVFLDPAGEEVDRILGYLPPDRFLADVSRIRAGDTFVACLESLSDDPGDPVAIRRAVTGLLERSDPESAIARLEAFRRAASDADRQECRSLMFEARVTLMTGLYERAAKLYRRGWDGQLAVPDTLGTHHLRALVTAGIEELPAAEQAARLRGARRADAAELLELARPAETDVARLPEVADFAFRNGLYRPAGDAYRRWFEATGDSSDRDDLNQAAWQLYLARTDLDLAVDLARSAWNQGPEPDVADTLGRLLYVRGEVERALELQRRAVAESSAADRALFDRVEQLMSRGATLDDRPEFEDYP